MSLHYQKPPCGIPNDSASLLLSPQSWRDSLALARGEQQHALDLREDAARAHEEILSERERSHDRRILRDRERTRKREARARRAERVAYVLIGLALLVLIGFPVGVLMVLGGR